MSHSLPPDRERFFRLMPVSRETGERLDAFRELLLKWQKRINLISPNTIEEIWTRHLLDSAQLIHHMPHGGRAGRLLDIGSGAGFPGIVLAIMGAADEVVLVESDQRKAAFLREALRVSGARAGVVADRIERQPALHADAITARACAPLAQLLAWSLPHMEENAFCLFLKGKNYTKEIVDAGQAGWTFDREIHASVTDNHGAVLKITNIIRG